MMIRDIFVPVFQNVEYGSQLDAAARLANCLDAHVNVVFMRPDVLAAAVSAPDMLVASGVVFGRIENEGKIALSSAKAQFNEWRVASGLASSEGDTSPRSASASWHERGGLVAPTMVQIGRVSDLIIVSRPDRFEGVTEEAFTAAVFDAGRPTLLVPDEIASDPLDHIVIAWNGSVQSARAIDGAMPMLQKAKRVSIFCAPRPADDYVHDLGLVEHLSRHGVRAEYRGSDEEPLDIGAALLEVCTVERATMIVMGAYSHSPMRERLLGGVTRHVIKLARIPVLMMH